MNNLKNSTVSIAISLFLLIVLVSPASFLIAQSNFSVTGENYAVVPKNFTFDRDLTTNDEGQDVQFLQCILNVKPITAYFGTITKSAVVKFQKAHEAAILTPAGLTEGTGYVGPSTRAYLNEQLSQRGSANYEGGCEKTNQSTGNGGGNSGSGSSQSGSGSGSGQSQQSTAQQNNDAWLLAYLLSSGRSSNSIFGNQRSPYGSNYGNNETVYPNRPAGPLPGNPPPLPDRASFQLQPGVDNPTLGQDLNSPYSSTLPPFNSGASASLIPCAPGTGTLYNTATGAPCPDNSGLGFGTGTTPPPPSDANPSSSSTNTNPLDFSGTTVYNSHFDPKLYDANNHFYDSRGELVWKGVPCGCSIDPNPGVQHTPIYLYENLNENRNRPNESPIYLLINSDSINITSIPPTYAPATCVIGHYRPLNPSDLCLTYSTLTNRCEIDPRFTPPLLKGVVTRIDSIQSTSGACQSAQSSTGGSNIPY